MNKTFLLSLPAAFAAACVVAQNPATAPAAPVETNYAAKAAEVQKAVGKFIDENCKGATANYNNFGYDKAIATLEAELKDFPYPNAQRIVLMKTLAYAYLDRAQDANKADIAKGHKLLEDATKLPGLSGGDLYSAKINLAEILWIEYRRDEAVKIYQEFLKPEIHVHQRRFLEGKLLAYTRETKGADAALAMYRDTFGYGADENAMKKYYLDNGMRDKAYPIIVKQIASLAAKTPLNVLKNAASELYSAVSPHVLATLKAKFDPQYAKLTAINPRAGENIFSGIRVDWSGSGALDSVSGPGTKEWFLDKYVACVSNSASVFPAFVQSRRCELPADKMMRLAKLAIGYAEANPGMVGRIKKEDLWSAHLYPVIADENNEGRAVNNANNVLKTSFPAVATNAADKANFYLQAAKIEYELGREDIARKFYSLREAMRAPQKNAEYLCSFVTDMPQDIPSVLASPAYKKLPRGVLDSKYGPNLKFLLETDAAITGRVIGDNAGISAPTEFVCWADRFGFKIFFRSYEKNTKAMRDGFAEPIGYEMYLAPTLEVPYHCILNHAASADGLDMTFSTQYTGPNDHVLLNPKMLRSSYQILNDGVAMLIDFPWRLFYGFVPKNGDKWHFEPIHWVDGGMTWGGSQSVHNRSSWGVIKFDGMTPESVTAIKRAILPAAAATYRNALSARANGCIDQWMDNELGDRDFYLSVLKPFIEARKWNEDVALVKADMTDADAVRIFDAAAKDWMNITEVVSRLRTDYLRDKRMSE